MAKNVAAPTPEILQAALQGLEAQREKLDEQIAHVRAMLGRRGARGSKALTGGATPLAMGAVGSKRILSPDARKRIAAAQRKRWAAFRKNKK